MQTAAPRTLTPGVHRAVIVGAEVGDFPWRASDANPRGLAVKTRLEVCSADGVVRLDDAADMCNVGRWNSIFKAAGVLIPHGVDPTAYLDALVGCEVDVTTRNVTVQRGKNAGTTRAVVNSWLPPIDR
jgi:hypothetical protein